MFALGERSLQRLQGTHPDLIRVVQRAITLSIGDFTVIQGVRTLEEEKANVACGASTTLHSRHLPNCEGLGCAVDLAAWVGNTVAYTPLELYDQIATAMKTAAAAENVPIECGADWQTFKDYGHFQLPWATYP